LWQVISKKGEYYKLLAFHRGAPVYNFIMGDLPFRRVDELLQDPSANMMGPRAEIKAVDPGIWLDIAGEIVSAHTHVLLEGRDAVIYADSPVWAHSVNQQRLTLLDSMLRKGLEVDTIRVRNQPPESKRTSSRSERKPSLISRDTAHILEQTATMIDHEALRLALLRLSRHGSNTDE
jgi:hypothetical protein